MICKLYTNDMVGFDDVTKNQKASYTVKCESSHGEVRTIKVHDFENSVITNQYSLRYIK